ncbi:hypothetical protein TNCV_1567541 [Trichonephila clavipes]|nr:hypothetical protein TNCV_1567541 [Trichonephila clavipes]
MADKVVLEFIESSKNIIDADSEDENEMNNAISVATSSEVSEEHHEKISFQWVPSHLSVCGNEIANGLAPEGSHKDSTLVSCLTFSEIASWVKQDVSSSWRQAFVHEWLRSGHTRAQRHVAGLKVYPSCPNYNVTQAAPATSCIGCNMSQLLSNPVTVLYCLKTKIVVEDLNRRSICIYHQVMSKKERNSRYAYYRNRSTIFIKAVENGMKNQNIRIIWMS